MRIASRMRPEGRYAPVRPSSGTLWAIGTNTPYGQLGLGDTTQRGTLTQVGSAETWTAVVAGTSHALALRADGSLWTWGYGGWGQLGRGNNSDALAPAQVGSDMWVDVSGGENHSLGIKSDGSLWAWGGNAFGQLGDDSTTAQNTPQAIGVGLGKTWARVAAGGWHSLALASDGTLWAWGRNLFDAGPKGGMLGQGDTTERHLPTQVGTDTDWASITASFISSAAIKTSGALYTWGGNHHGCLGTPISTYLFTTPTQLGSDTTWAQVAMHSDHTTAVKSDGSMWAWGENNEYQQLGDGTGVDSTSPVQVGAGTSWASVDRGYYQGNAIAVDGTLWFWGRNDSQQVGDGTTTSRSVPYQHSGTWLRVAGGFGFHLGIKLA